MIDAREALERLMAGNRRFVAGERRPLTGSPAELTNGQSPHAIVLGCSDSRVPIEIVFDQGLGDLFVIRVAGNVVAPSQVGSVEFAVETFGTRLVVVLGHSQCGAVQTTLEQLRRPTDQRSPNLRAIVDRIGPALEGLIAEGADLAAQATVEAAVRLNVRAACDHLRHGSALLEELVRTDGLLVVGAEYALETGAVTFLDEEPR